MINISYYYIKFLYSNKLPQKIPRKKLICGLFDYIDA